MSKSRSRSRSRSRSGSEDLEEDISSQTNTENLNPIPPGFNPMMMMMSMVPPPLGDPLPSKITWEWLADDGWVVYDEESQLLIEQAYQNKEPTLDLGHGYFGSVGGYSIDFGTMQQIKVVSGYVRSIRRNPPPAFMQFGGELGTNPTMLNMMNPNLNPNMQGMMMGGIPPPSSFSQRPYRGRGRGRHKKSSRQTDIIRMDEDTSNELQQALSLFRNDEEREDIPVVDIIVD